jgi:hypothetical protein
MSQQKPTLEREQIEGLERPCLYSTGSGLSRKSVYHLPEETESGEITTLCHSAADRIRALEFSIFKRRRNPAFCKKCRKKGGEPYSGDSA